MTKKAAESGKTIYALTRVVPICPLCGSLADFQGEPSHVWDAVPVNCRNAACGWTGISTAVNVVTRPKGV